jgi:hypothetical protein
MKRTLAEIKSHFLILGSFHYKIQGKFFKAELFKMFKCPCFPRDLECF